MAFVSNKNFKRSRYTANDSGRKNTTTENVSNRDFVVICADRSGRVATFAENDKYVESFSIYSNDTKLNMYTQLVEILKVVPTNAEGLLDKQLAIYVPSAIVGNLGDMYRSDSYASCRDIMLEVEDLLITRSLNCFLVDIKGSNATIVQHAYEYIKEESKKANAKADGVEYISSTTKSGKDAIADADAKRLLELKEKYAKVEDELLDTDDPEIEAKLEKKLAKLHSAISRLTGQEEPKEESATGAVNEELQGVEI